MGLSGNKIIGIIQARMGSTRLPGKSMLPLLGEPLLYRFIERVLRCKQIDQIVLATTEKEEDDCLCDVANKLGVESFRGSETDLIKRFYDCAVKYGADIVVRFCADNPLVEPEEVDRLIEKYLSDNQKGWLYSNTHNIDFNGYPDGLGCEIYDINLLKWVDKEIEGSDNREHPHKHFYDNGLVRTIKCPYHLKGYSDLKLDVNTRKEYEFIRDIYDSIGHNFFHAEDYLSEVSQWQQNGQH